MHDPHHPAHPPQIGGQPSHLPPRAPQHSIPPTHHSTPGHAGIPHGIPGAAVPRMPQQKLTDLDPISLDDEAPAEAVPSKRIKAFGGESVRQQHDWKRKATANGTGAVRVRSFHGKYSDSGVEYLDNAINDWLDSHPEVEVKFVTSTVGVFEGKIREPALVLNLWY